MRVHLLYLIERFLCGVQHVDLLSAIYVYHQYEGDVFAQTKEVEAVKEAGDDLRIGGFRIAITTAITITITTITIGSKPTIVATKSSEHPNQQLI